MNDSRDIKDDLSAAVLREKIADVKSVASINFSLTVPYLMVGGLAQMACQAKPLMENSSKSKLWQVFGNQPGTLTGLKWIGYGFAILSLVTGIVFKHKQRKFEKELNSYEFKQEPLQPNTSQFEVHMDEPQANKSNNIRGNTSTSSPTTTIHSNMTEATRLQEAVLPLNELGKN